MNGMNFTRKEIKKISENPETVLSKKL